MKKRNGFVTNSSSTSYVCEISGHKEVFRDSEDHRNYGFYRCDNDHRRQKLYDGEYINYVYKKLGFTEDVVFAQIKADFADYKKFKEYLRS